MNYYGGSYNNPADGMELCLPHDFSQDVETYIEFFNYGSGQDATLELRDGYGNTIQFSQSSTVFRFLGDVGYRWRLHWSILHWVMKYSLLKAKQEY